MHSHILEPSDQEFVRSDGIKMLVEIKRLHDESQGGSLFPRFCTLLMPM